MPRTSEHLDQAAHNEAFFASIEVATYSDWAVTALFYSALHYVDAYLARQGHEDPGDHDMRDTLMRNYPVTRAVWNEYRRLKSFSRSARYYAARFKPGEVTGLRLGSLEPIKDRIRSVL